MKVWTGNELERRGGEWDREMTAGRIRTRVPESVCIWVSQTLMPQHGPSHQIACRQPWQVIKTTAALQCYLFLRAHYLHSTAEVPGRLVQMIFVNNMHNYVFYVWTLFLKVCFYVSEAAAFGRRHVIIPSASTRLTTESPRMKVVGWTGVEPLTVGVHLFWCCVLYHCLPSVSCLGIDSMCQFHELC